jgi:anion-transporting  ArsA/GET3 family ATPase
MIVVKEFPERTFANKEELFSALRENKSTLIAQKKMITKESDSLIHYVEVEEKSQEANKADIYQEIDVSKIKAKLVINTTKLMDSHSDVHLNGIWNKSSKEQKNLMLLQEHQMKFNSIISSEVKASVKKMSWKSLGFDFEGETEALIFDTEISKERNPFMFEQYTKGYVKEHSVGMRYVKLELAINSESKYDQEEKEVWDKYINEIVNKEVAEAQGYFWAVTEAKIVEGSAVVKGSNFATPTISIEAVKEDTSIETKEEPTIEVTQRMLKELLNKFN